MFTRCPKCHALYELSVSELRAGHGEVLCGRCRIIFSAINSLADSAEDATSTPRFRLKIPLLDEAYPEEEEDVFSGLGAANDTQESRAAYPEPEQMAYFEDARRPESSFWVLAFLIALALLFWQGFHFERDRLARDTRFRPWLETGCRLAGCALPPLRDLARIEILDRQLAPAEGTADGLEFYTVLANYAGFPQQFPRLKLSLTHFDGDPIAQRVFPPEEYLPQGVPADVMPVGESFEIKLLLAPPEKTVGGFTIELL
jgi:predicted Zn finger-like uncharacterized protein